ncbi:hypothetical protein ACFWG0_28140 [Streptomyces yangpuensis]
MATATTTTYPRCTQPLLRWTATRSRLTVDRRLPICSPAALTPYAT